MPTPWASPETLKGKHSLLIGPAQPGTRIGRPLGLHRSYLCVCDSENSRIGPIQPSVHLRREAHGELVEGGQLMRHALPQRILGPDRLGHIHRELQPLPRDDSNRSCRGLYRAGQSRSFGRLCPGEDQLASRADLGLVGQREQTFRRASIVAASWRSRRAAKAVFRVLQAKCLVALGTVAARAEMRFLSHRASPWGQSCADLGVPCLRTAWNAMSGNPGLQLVPREVIELNAGDTCAVPDKARPSRGR
jgi:hypothetical protein